MMMNFFKLLGLILICINASMTMADETDKQYLLTEKTYKLLSVAQALMSEEKYAEAETKLNSLLKQTTEGSYDKAVVQQTLGYLYSSEGDYKRASVTFQQALDSHALPEKVSHNLRYNLAQLLIADEQYKSGISLLEEWLKKETKPENSAYVLLATAYYRQSHYKNTIKYISIAISKDPEPKEAWLQLLLSSHLELKEYKSAIKVQETLITRYPYKESYWRQLTALYLQQNKEFSALAVKALAQRLELGDSKTLLSLIDMYRYLNIPFKAAQLLLKGIDDGVLPSNIENLNRLADNWLAARETEAAADILKQLANLEDTGEAHLKYGRVLFALEKWQETIAPLDVAVSKLNKDEQGPALLLLGMAHYHLGNLEQSLKLFTKAVSYDEQRYQAGQWLRHVQKQMEDQSNAES
jgi:tetratricopeptide (TPR) repeat protein